MQLAWCSTWQDAAPDDSDSALSGRLGATLRVELKDVAKAIRIHSATFFYRFPIDRVAFTIIPDGLAPRIGKTPLSETEPDVLIPAGVRIAVQGPDDNWVTVEPVGFRDAGFGSSLPLAPLMAAGLIIAVVSTWTARRLVAPLDRLVEAAARVGNAREPIKVSSEGLHEFAAVARAFEDMQQRLLSFVDGRTRMLAAISHDLRTSLTRLRLSAEDFRDEAAYTALNAEIDEMQSMVVSTLAFARGEARFAPNQRIDLASLLISLTDEATDSGRSCRYQGSDHAEILGHPVSVKRAFRNLIENAVKYGEKADVALATGEHGIEVTIDDRGPGIPEASQEAAFEPYQRLDAARDSDRPGAGLGLTIARDVIRSHGGSIALANRKSGGLRVTVSLPLAASQGQPAIRST